jgi:hypothetical protein
VPEDLKRRRVKPFGLSSVPPSRFELRHIGRINDELLAKLRTVLKLTFPGSKELDPDDGRDRRKRNV